MTMDDRRPFLYKPEGLPEEWPTNHLPADFCEQLGRCVASFGFLEEVAKKAIFAVSGTKPVETADHEAAYAAWIKFLEKAIKEPLGRLIDLLDKQISKHPEIAMLNPSDLIDDLKHLKIVRDVICHGSWPPLNRQGASIPIYIDRHLNKWQEPIDVAYLVNLRGKIAEVIVGLANLVATMGYQFPGSKGPGKPIWST
jgi:hypothetical protein